MQTQIKLLSLMLSTILVATACKPETQAPMDETPAAATDMPASDSMAANDAMTQAGPAKYQVVFTPLWTKANFPFEYPDTSLIHKPHFSGLIGTAHNASYNLFKDGVAPTPGLERLSEMGKHDPLDAEINAAIAAGNALALSESGPLKDFSQTANTEVAVDDAHPMVSLVAMIAPSPDWFAGVSDVNLIENGAWTANKTVDFYAWDSGGDDGTTYLADDVDTSPKKPSQASADQHFMKDGKVRPVGRLTFTKL